MNLIRCEGKKVRITDIEEQIWEGVVTDYIYPEDNEPEEIESIIIDCKRGKYIGKPVEFTEREIKSIEIIEKKKLAG